MSSLVAIGCQNCAHIRCMFHGENRAPVYTSGVVRDNGYTSPDGSCWIDPTSEFGQTLGEKHFPSIAPKGG